MGGPEMVDTCLLSPSNTVTRIIVLNLSLPIEVRSYTLTVVSALSEDDYTTKYLKYVFDPKWYERLKNSVK